MSLTTHQDIRVESGFQSRYYKESFLSEPTGTTVFYVRSDDPVKFVPDWETGSTTAGVSDVQVWLGLSGIGGVSRMNVVSIDNDSGSVTLDTAPATGSSLTISYSSSPIRDAWVEEKRKQAESTVNQRLSLCYDLPISPTPSVIKRLATQLASALLLIQNYGIASRDTAADGYELYERMMGDQEAGAEDREGRQYTKVGEIGMICTTGYQLVDDDGNIISRNDEGEIEGSMDYKAGGRVSGRLYDITEEEFRFKESQRDANQYQPGSADQSWPPIRT